MISLNMHIMWSAKVLKCFYCVYVKCSSSLRFGFSFLNLQVLSVQYFATVASVKTWILSEDQFISFRTICTWPKDSDRWVHSVSEVASGKETWMTFEAQINSFLIGFNYSHNNSHFARICLEKHICCLQQKAWGWRARSQVSDRLLFSLWIVRMQKYTV